MKNCVPEPSPCVAESAQMDLPAVLPGHWETGEGLQKAREYAPKSRANLAMGDRTDLALANALYLADGDLPIQTAAKERMRWLSVQLALATKRADANYAGWMNCRDELRKTEEDQRNDNRRAEAAEKALKALVSECAAEFMLDGKWVDDGQLVRRSTFNRANALVGEAPSKTQEDGA